MMAVARGAVRVLLLIATVCAWQATARLNVRISAEEYWRLTGELRQEAVLIVEGGHLISGTPLVVPTCQHTLALEWYSAEQVHYWISSIQTNQMDVLPVVSISVPMTGLLSNTPQALTFQFDCVGSGDVAVTMMVFIGNQNSYNGNSTKLSMIKKCDVSCHDNHVATGESCEQMVCENGGSCVDRHGNHGLCQCTAGYTGVHCEKATCFPSCKNGGHCVRPNKCLCRKGFYGSSCKSAMCYPSCLNGGWCVKVEVCLCLPPYYGIRCEQKGVITVHTPLYRHYHISQSDNAVLTCVVIAIPAVTIRWLRNGKPVAKGNHHYLIFDRSHELLGGENKLTSSLIIYDVMTTDTGWYTCVASNGLVTKTTHGYLVVYDHDYHSSTSDSNCIDCDDEDDQFGSGSGNL